jgi:hypothetical protein
MNELRIFAIGTLIFTGVIGFLRFGFSWAALILSVGMTTLMCIPMYFQSRRSKAPTQAETFFATAWLWLRRVLGWLLALMFLVASFSAAFSGRNLVPAVVFFVLAAAMGYFGWVGQGPSRGQMKDDIKLHKENKERYKWKI